MSARLVPEWKSDLLVPASILLQVTLSVFLVVSPRMVHRLGRTNFGLGTALSAPILCLASYVLSPLSTILLGDGLAPSIVLACACSAVYLYTSTCQRLERASSRGKGLVDLLEVPWDTVLGWWLLQELSFYSTGHQPTFSTIHWHAAFVGFSGSNYGTSDSSASFLTTVALPAVLIGWNTFCARLLFGVALPLLLLSPFALWLACPSVRRHYSELGGDAPTLQEAIVVQEDFDRGEVYMLERPEVARAQAFKLCCKFMCLMVSDLIQSLVQNCNVSLMLGVSFDVYHDVCCWPAAPPDGVEDLRSSFRLRGRRLPRQPGRRRLRIPLLRQGALGHGQVLQEAPGGVMLVGLA